MTRGTIRLSGVPVQIHSPHHAQQLGISMIYQEFNLSPYLSVAENIFLGREPRVGSTPFVNWSRLYQDARDILARIGAEHGRAQARQRVQRSRQQQMVEIAKALSFHARVIIMDEPSATLTEHELAALFELMRNLKKEAIGLIYISHRLDEIFEVGDRVTVMRGWRVRSDEGGKRGNAGGHHQNDGGPHAEG